MQAGTKEWFNEFGNEYKRWLKTWQYIRDLNQSDIYIFGEAKYNAGGDIVVTFDDAEQKAAYAAKFPRGY